jgi:MinD superfamily P-loop ATPase
MRPTAKELAQRCLKEKWFEGSKSFVNDECPFCEDAKEIQGILVAEDQKLQLIEESCDYCQCPPDLCHEMRIADFICEAAGNIKTIFEDGKIRVADLPLPVLQRVRAILEAVK